MSAPPADGDVAQHMSLVARNAAHDTRYATRHMDVGKNGQLEVQRWASMDAQPSTPTFNPCAAAGWLLWALLAGYLIFNRPFAGLGFPPLYAGEIVLALGALALLPNFSEAFLEPLKNSWTFRLIAVFGLYSVIRGVIDAQMFGIAALRDSVIGGYALAAFLAPALWKETARATGTPALSHIKKLIQIISFPAVVWAAALYFGVVPLATVPQTKMDFVALSAAIAAWTSFVAALSNCPCADRKNWPKFSAWLSGAIACAVLVLLFQNRTMWLTALPLLALLGAAKAYTPGRRKFLGAGALIAGIAVALVALKLGRAFEQLNRTFALDRALDFSLAQAERDPASIPLATPDAPPKIEIAPLPPASNEGKSKFERLLSLFSTDASQFQTTQGRLGADAVRWRANFWMRCVFYTLHRAPLFGIGHGGNLTLTLRNTPAWMYYIESQQVDPPNRSPHSAHVTVFTRLGLFGLLIWLGILALTICNGLQFCWRARTDAAPEFRAMLAILGVWLMYLWAMSFGVVLENPFGGIWFWALTGVVASNAKNQVLET